MNGVKSDVEDEDRGGPNILRVLLFKRTSFIDLIYA